MSRPAIIVEQLSKCYRLKPRSWFAEWRKSLWRSERSTFAGNATEPASDPDLLWALKDVSFEVPAGSSLGLVGRNGSGKSTLLKILSRITAPTAGRATIHGRVGALLEVGSGFHPELTGRENIFLNGAMLGISRSSIMRQFDAIVDFAEVERFLDTPVKHYSSGMYMRLAFAVAAHLEAEVLLVDEVLAVGDTQFQKKCLGKVRDITGHGRTVLFVSHSLSTVTRLCERAILLDQGRLIDVGPAAEIVQRYLDRGQSEHLQQVWDDSSAPGDETVRLRAVRVQGTQTPLGHGFDVRCPVTVEIEFELRQPRRTLPHVYLQDNDGILLFVTADREPQFTLDPLASGRYRSQVSVPGNFLAEGLFSVTVALIHLGPPANPVMERDLLTFEIVDPLLGGSVRGDLPGHYPGVVRPMLPWVTTRTGDL